MGDVSAICATCQNAKALETENEYLCKKRGVVDRDFTCRKYKLNLMLKRPPKKRILDTSRYKAEDFSIE